MSIIRFKSVLLPDQVGYQLSAACDDTTLWRQYCNTPGLSFISTNLQEYGTLGDTGVQHTPLGPARREHLVDCVLSLTDYLIDCIKVDGIRSQIVRDALLQLYLPTPRAKQIEMAAKLKWREDKKQWFSWVEEKVTSNPKVRYDRRYHELDDHNFNGLWPYEQVAACYYIENHNAMLGVLGQTWIRYRAQQHLEPNGYGSPWIKELKGNEWDAMRVLFSFIEGWQNLAHSVSWLETVKQNETQRMNAEQKEGATA